jgi:hypothetical protein
MFAEPGDGRLQRFMQRKRLRAGGGAEAFPASISRIPDYGIEVFIILTGSSAEIGVEFLRPQGWIG